MNREYVQYRHCVEKMKLMAGLSGNKTKSIREAIRDDSFHDTIQEAIHCRLMERWPLREQQIFLEELSGLTEAEKRIRIYETAYELHKLQKLMLTSL